MKYDPRIQHRRSIRLSGYDYSRPGAYFVTICTAGKECFLGRVEGGEMSPSLLGHAAADCWIWLDERYPHVDLDAFVVMPNHLHGIVVMGDAPAGGVRKPLGGLIGAFKVVSTRRINELRATAGSAVWQRNYYEHVIRGEDDVARIREYIANNPARWSEDSENPLAPRQSSGRRS